MFFYIRVGTEGEHSVILEAIAADFSSVLTNMNDFRHSHVLLVACIELCCYLYYNNDDLAHVCFLGIVLHTFLA